ATEGGATNTTEGGATNTTEGGATNTTLAIVATNATLSKERAHLLSLAAHDGFEAAIRPAHTLWDVDTVFTVATGEVQAGQHRLEEVAVQTVAEAIRRAVLAAESVPGVPSCREAGHPATPADP